MAQQLEDKMQVFLASVSVHGFRGSEVNENLSAVTPAQAGLSSCFVSSACPLATLARRAGMEKA